MPSNYSKQLKNKIFTRQEEAALQERRGGVVEGAEQVVILSYDIDGNIRDGEKRSDNNNGTKKTVMICDDEKDILLPFAIELETKYNVLTAESGEQCIKKYLDATHSGRKIDLILLDYKLGDTTGDYVAHKIKELKDVKIIMVTAYELEPDMIRELKDNEFIMDIVQKLIAIDLLMAKVEHSIRN